MRNWWPIVQCFFLLLVLAVLCFWIDSFHLFLERHHNRVHPISEISVRITPTPSVFQLRIEALCPVRPRQVDKDIACRAGYTAGSE